MNRKDRPEWLRWVVTIAAFSLLAYAFYLEQIEKAARQCS